MTKLTLKHDKRIKEDISIDIEFPIYLKYDSDYDHAVSYSIIKLRDDRTFVEIDYSKGYGLSKPSYKIKEGYFTSFDRISHYFGNDSSYSHTNNSSEFDRLLQEIRRLLATCT